ncbi:hypothetical protein [Caballeronia sp. LZ028]|uniref:hypothetical protein n=1 Tax=Caballeronia sp. LZ028 TaxID=3038563 RepID=UPI002863BC0A|nr:hypothetical protein [Caballeronia sp. LZ028]MDR5768295.1 hypothetical protein [Caballeronia sp. LZ028]
MIADGLAGALCVLAALSAGSSMRASRGRRETGALLAAACFASGASGGTALVLALVAGFIGYRSARATPGVSAQSLFATMAFVAWALPGPDSAYAVLAGGALAALACVVVRRHTNGASANLQSMHLACAGACAAFAYVLGVQSDVISVIAMLAPIGAHSSPAMGANSAAPLAYAMSAAAAGGLALAAAIGGSHGALVVAAVAIAVGCTRSATLVGIVRETP